MSERFSHRSMRWDTDMHCHGHGDRGLEVDYPESAPVRGSQCLLWGALQLVGAKECMSTRQLTGVSLKNIGRNGMNERA